MTDEEKILKSKIGDKNPFKVPEHYFEQLTTLVMEQIPAPTVKTVEVKRTLFYRLRPVFYAAACVLMVVVSFAVLFDQEAESDAGQSVMAEQQTTDCYFEDAADYMMIDNNEIYACLSE